MREVKAGICRLRHRSSQSSDAKPPDHLLRTVLATNGSGTGVSGQRIIYIFANLGSTKSILEAVTERMEHARSVGYAEAADLAAKPFRPSLAEATLGPRCKQRKQAGAGASFASDFFHEAQKSNADKFGMYRHNARRPRGLQSPTLLWVLADCDHPDLAGLVSGHIRYSKRSEFAKTGACE
jgi:hypothetical protein